MFSLPKLTDKNIKQWLVQFAEQVEQEINSVDLDNMTDSTRQMIQNMYMYVSMAKETAHPIGSIVIYQATTNDEYGLNNIPEDICEMYGGNSWEWEGFSQFTYRNGLPKYNHYFKRLQ